MKRQLGMVLLSVGFIFAPLAAVVGDDAKPSTAEFIVHKGLVYSDVADGLKLDLFLPKQTSQPLPCVIVIQGGGFRAQDGQRFRPIAELMAKNGLAAALIAYRGRPEHDYRATVADVKTAVRFVRKISGDYGIDPDRIGAMGRSAGATLAVLVAVSGGVAGLEDQGPHAEYSSNIQAAAGIAGVYDFVARFTDEEQQALQPNLKTKLKTNGEWIGAPFSPTDDHWQRASAINHVDATDPPLLLLHSRNDQTVPWQQSRDMHKKLTTAGIAAELEITDTGGHRGPATAEKSMVVFFKKQLANRTP